MLKKYNYIFFFLLISIPIVAQNSQKFQDSIKIVINNISSDSLRAVEYYNTAIYAFQPLNDLKLSRSYLDSSLFYSRKSNVKDYEAKCFFLYGVIERFKGNYDLALEHLDKNLKHFKNDSTNKSYALFQVGAIHSARGDYENSLKTFFEVLKIFEQKKDSFAIASAYNNIALLYGEMKKNDIAIDTYKKALNMFEQLGQQRDVSNVLRNIGEMYLREYDTIKGKETIEKSLVIARKINESYSIGYSLYVLGTVNLNTQPKKGLQQILEAKLIMEKGNYKELLIGINISLGRYYKNLNEYFNAIAFYNNALNLSKELKELPQKEYIYRGLADIYVQQSNFKDAYNSLSNYIIVKDSLLNIENLKTINLLEKQFETEKKQNKILQLSEQKLKNEAAIEKQQTRINRLTIGLIGLAFLFGAAFIIFKQRSNNKKQQELITAIADTQIEERQRIAQDLHDSIGGSLALTKNKLEMLLVSEKEKSQEITVFLEILSETGEQIRQISHNMMPGELVKFGLVSAVRTAIDQIDTKNLQVHLYTHDLEERIDQTKEIHTFRIIQEIIQNVLKHAQANTLNVHLNKHAKKLSLLVEDDGIGFSNNNQNIQGIGLKNIKNRVANLKGKLNIDSDIGKGTTFNIEIPL